MDFGKYKYEQNKKLQKARKKQHVTHLKEVKLRPKIEEHDYRFKVNNGRRFLELHDKVKFTVTFRGREMAHTDAGFRLLEKVVKDLEEVGQVENAPGGKEPGPPDGAAIDRREAGGTKTRAGSGEGHGRSRESVGRRRESANDRGRQGAVHRRYQGAVHAAGHGHEAAGFQELGGRDAENENQPGGFEAVQADGHREAETGESVRPPQSGLEVAQAEAPPARAGPRRADRTPAHAKATPLRRVIRVPDTRLMR